MSRSPLDALRIEAEFGCQVEYHPEIASTNDRAIQLSARDDLRLPLLVLAEQQTAGRGRGANPWWSAEGSLTFSLLMQTAAANLPPPLWPQLSLTAGLAVCEALERLLPAHLWGVKWPNDVFVDARKICGILIESPSAARERLIIGIGINVNNSFAAAPDEQREKATALCDLAGAPFDRTTILLAVLRGLMRRWEQLAEIGFGSFVEDWRRYCILRGKTVALAQGAEKIVGYCHSIDENGALVLQTETDQRHCIGGTIERFG